MSPLLHDRILTRPQRAPEDSAALARRTRRVSLLKKALPVAGALLLVVLAMAPNWHGPQNGRVSYHVTPNAGPAPASKLQDASYHGTDQHGQPYTLTAATAVQQDADNVVLTTPMGDITLTSGAWLMLKSDSGLYHQKEGLLGLTGNVMLYRNDGTTMSAPVAQIDLHAGSASSSDPVQAQGPFGTLDAAGGFTLINRGAQVTFTGPATLTLMQAQ
jgi:lipopolysaccharide export system protein LptC